MDEVNIKYLSQFNPILVVPVLSAVVGAILVFVFGFKRPNEPRFQSSSSLDSLKKSKRKANPTKTSDYAVQSSKQQIASSAKIGAGKKVTDLAATVSSKKSSNNNNASSNNNNNNNSNNNNNIIKKKTEERKSENGSPTKKVVNKKTGKEAPVSKKSKSNKNQLPEADGYNEKPADFDDGNWFTVQSKSTKRSVGNQENASPKVQGTKTNKSSKSAKSETKQSSTPVISSDELNVSDNLVAEKTKVEQKSEHNVDSLVDSPITTASIVVDEPTVVVENEIPIVEKKPSASVPLKVAEVTVDNAIAFDELGEWTDAKPDRKRGNKKKSRKD